ncbi:MAG TPA: DUF2797 domain-containing protein [Flavobacteriales bacterium]|nr:DUF2797 domain-containing protein [Flavobacteriales bacterium]
MNRFLGPIEKMRTELRDIVHYSLTLGNDSVNMNGLIDREISLRYTGRIFCVSCSKQTKKSFGQGFCYNCFANSPENAECIIRPELCEAHMGGGRDPEWEKNHHFHPHYVYLALSNEVKVGVTRHTQVPTRWIDQGASKAIVIAEVPYRQLAGLIEMELKNHVTDKTNWQRMLKNEVAIDIELTAKKKEILEKLPEHLVKYAVAENHVYEINYPVLTYPEKIVSQNFDKSPEIKGLLKGIKGQYLIFDGGVVLNLRNASGYEVELCYE